MRNPNNDQSFDALDLQQFRRNQQPLSQEKIAVKNTLNQSAYNQKSSETISDTTTEANSSKDLERLSLLHLFKLNRKHNQKNVRRMSSVIISAATASIVTIGLVWLFMVYLPNRRVISSIQQAFISSYSQPSNDDSFLITLDFKKDFLKNVKQITLSKTNRSPKKLEKIDLQFYDNSQRPVFALQSINDHSKKDSFINIKNDQINLDQVLIKQFSPIINTLHDDLTTENFQKIMTALKTEWIKISGEMADTILQFSTLELDNDSEQTKQCLWRLSNNLQDPTELATTIPNLVVFDFKISNADFQKFFHCARQRKLSFKDDFLVRIEFDKTSQKIKNIKIDTDNLSFKAKTNVNLKADFSLPKQAKNIEQFLK